MEPVNRLLPPSWFEGDPVVIAKKLLGKTLKKDGVSGVIVETEAYGTDPASHAFRDTPRAKLMRETHGMWYVYFTYGMHWCANITTNKKGAGAVLIRAIEPREGIALMERRRGTHDVRALCSGPAKLCQAFGITGKDNGRALDETFGIFDAPEIPRTRIEPSSRIGIKEKTPLPWRFSIKHNPFVSR